MNPIIEIIKKTINRLFKTWNMDIHAMISVPNLLRFAGT